ncbi:MAG: hypothetical protein MUC45_07400 [Actinomycetia bacterium]|nr:hypothetical protein [Actinomycetes bacterium]
MITRFGRLAACGLLAAAPALVALPAAAAEPEPAGVTVGGTAGCAGTVRTADAAGTPLGVLDTAAGIAASSDAPLRIDPAGTLTYDGASAAVITDHTWTVTVAGQEVASGGSANSGKVTTASGTVDVADYLPVSVTGTVLAQATVTGQGGSCTGDVWVEVEGNPWTSANGVAGLVLTGAGLLGLAAVRPRRLADAAGGAA